MKQFATSGIQNHPISQPSCAHTRKYFAQAKIEFISPEVTQVEITAGLLEAWELMQLDLKAELAVLSACETARGRIGGGEGVIGFSWAMFIAGVPSTVVSQWKVESASTCYLMVNFHRALLSPVSKQTSAVKADALRQAALRLMRNPETSHPLYRAGFVLVGHDG